MRFLDLFPAMGPGLAGDPGLIGPDTMVWDISREFLVVLGGPAALMLQVAHPLVAAGVAEHSNFAEDPLKRLLGTLDAVLVIVFGDTDQAHAMAAHVAAMHRPVHGRLTADVGSFKADCPYSAFDPELALWVFATLVEMALEIYHRFIRRITPHQRESYYQQMRPFAAQFGIQDAMLPPTYAAFQAYFRRMCREQLAVGPAAWQISGSVFEAWVLGLPVTPAGQLLAGYLLPTIMAAAYDLPHGRPSRMLMGTLAWLSRRLVPLLPRRWRYWPHYHTAKRRLANT